MSDVTNQKRLGPSRPMLLKVVCVSAGTTGTLGPFGQLRGLERVIDEDRYLAHGWHEFLSS